MSSSSALQRLAAQFSRQMASSAGGGIGRKVAVLGAAGGIGQSLSMLMKMNQQVSHLSLYDIAGTPGVGADVSHINTRAQVKVRLTDAATRTAHDSPVCLRRPCNDGYL
eukprot:361875-Chlamydomonas_euryale.AAC.10